MDLGISGKSAQCRGGFEGLVSDISLKRVGILFGYEVSRIARNCADWFKLIELCALFGTLIGDVDGIYDVNNYNDRLLMGLKGTMSEAELHIMKNRLYAGRLNKAKRGELVHNLPTGYIRDNNIGVVKDPDKQVQKTLELVFIKFDELGSCQKVVNYLAKNKILLPRRMVGGIKHGELEWKEVTRTAVINILHNPAYAGAFVYGRRQSNPHKKKEGQFYSEIERKEIDEWISLVKDKYPAYISWEKFIANQNKIKDNYIYENLDFIDPEDFKDFISQEIHAFTTFIKEKDTRLCTLRGEAAGHARVSGKILLLLFNAFYSLFSDIIPVKNHLLLQFAFKAISVYLQIYERSFTGKRDEKLYDDQKKLYRSLIKTIESQKEEILEKEREHISVNAVKRHTQSIYRKCNINNKIALVNLFKR